MITLSNHLIIPDEEIELTAIRSQGAGGQNVNKVSSAIHLRFNIRGSSLPEHIQARLLALKDSRITAEGVVVLKAQRFRTQEKNREDALARLTEIIESVLVVQKARVATRPSRAAKTRRVDSKTKRGTTKALRGRITD